MTTTLEQSRPPMRGNNRGILRAAIAFAAQNVKLHVRVLGLHVQLAWRRGENRWLRWRLAYLLGRRWRRTVIRPDPSRIRIRALDRTRTLLRIRLANQETGRWN